MIAITTICGILWWPLVCTIDDPYGYRSYQIPAMYDCDPHCRVQ